MPLLHSADEADIIAQDATQQQYTYTFSATSGTRYAFGIVALQTDAGDQVTFSRDDGGGFDSIQARTLDADNLENLTSAYFEDGVIWAADFTGTVTIKAAVTSGTMLIRGFIAREPAAESGIVEDQGTGTHCSPRACMYAGDRYELHSEMYTANVYLSVNSAPVGRVFDGLVDDYNEHYHNGVAVVARSDGVVLVQTGHDVAGVRVRFLPSGNIGSITAVFTTGGASNTYCHAVVIADEVFIVTREDNNLVMVRVQNINATPSHTRDVVCAANINYPRAMVVDLGGSTPVIFCGWNIRNGGRWETICGAIFAPSQGTHGEWYSLNGHAATVQAALGTAVSPRFTSTQIGTLTSSGDGVQIMEAFGGSSYRYMLEGACYETTQYPASGVTVAKGKVLMFFAESLISSPVATLRAVIMSEGTRYLDGTDFSPPTALRVSHNSIRISAYCGYRQDGTAVWAFTDRGGRNRRHAYGEITDEYYDWGTSCQLSVFTIANEFSATIALTKTQSIRLNTELTAGWMSRVEGDADTLVYQTAISELHPSHRERGYGNDIDLTALIAGEPFRSAVTRVAVNTTTGVQEITIPDLGWTPKACRIELTNATADGTPAANADMVIGFSDTIRIGMASFIDLDNQATTDSARITTVDFVARKINTATALAAANSLGAIKDGISLNWSIAPGAAYLMTVTLYGGEDYRAYCGKATLGNVDVAVDVTAPNFQPALVEFTGVGAADSTTISTSALLTYGAATSAVQRCVFVSSIDNTAAHRTNGRFSTAYAGGQHGAALSWAAEVGSFDSQGFSVTPRVGNADSDILVYLAHHFGDRAAWLGTIDTPTSTGVFNVTSPNFQPQLAVACMSMQTAIDTTVASDPKGGAFGISTLTPSAEYSVAIAGEDNSDPSDTQTATDNALYLDIHDGTSGFRATGSMISTGFRWNFSAVDGTSRKWFGWAVEELPEPVYFDRRSSLRTLLRRGR